MKNKKILAGTIVALGLCTIFSTGINSAHAEDSWRGGDRQKNERNDDNRGERGQYRYASSTRQSGDDRPMMMMRPLFIGNVTAVNGSTLTVVGRYSENRQSASTTYTVDTSSATILKNGAVSTIANIAINDKVMIEGAVTGNNIKATTIRVGNMRFMNKDLNDGDQLNINGSGEPVIAGNISQISGSVVSVTNGNGTYSVTTLASTTVKRNGSNAAITDLAVGDHVIVQGTINGNSVSASLIIDQTSSTPGNNGSKGFWGGVGTFLKKLFKF